MDSRKNPCSIPIIFCDEFYAKCKFAIFCNYGQSRDLQDLLCFSLITTGSFPLFRPRCVFLHTGTNINFCPKNSTPKLVTIRFCHYVLCNFRAKIQVRSFSKIEFSNKNWSFGPVCSRWCWCATFKVLMQLNRICLPRIVVLRRLQESLSLPIVHFCHRRIWKAFPAWTEKAIYLYCIFQSIHSTVCIQALYFSFL